jgi:hypothetical protein
MRRLCPALFCGVLLAGCMPAKYNNATFDPTERNGYRYHSALVEQPGGVFDVLVMAGAGIRWIDELEIRDDFMAIGKARAARHCGGREAELLDAAKPSPDAASLDMRFRCK